jgi:hypothetical protein
MGLRQTKKLLAHSLLYFSRNLVQPMSSDEASGMPAQGKKYIAERATG